MKVSVFASGSGGNCLLLSDGSTYLLIDAGISMSRIVSCLAKLGISMDKLGGVLITHEHSDHVLGLRMLVKHYGVPIYAPHTVVNRLIGQQPELEESLGVIPVGEPFVLGSISITAFHTPHDTDESVGYRAESGGVFALATDMGCVTEEVMNGLAGADTVMIESNHDIELLRCGRYPVGLKRRILSDHGHLSNPACAALARELFERGTGSFILAHLSRENNRPELALSCAGEALAGTDARLYVAPVLGCLSLEVGGCSE